MPVSTAVSTHWKSSSSRDSRFEFSKWSYPAFEITPLYLRVPKNLAAAEAESRLLQICLQPQPEGNMICVALATFFIGEAMASMSPTFLDWVSNTYGHMISDRLIRADLGPGGSFGGGGHIPLQRTQ
ncbi:unnamed protein product [Toxocara canis]|uniref:Uncharacterized protein n=1 Tax=Toxocara canis TaxID=6265 RepID=A0A183U5T4_TOXCA|nr:unnamed protein product [Toxocara canis]